MTIIVKTNLKKIITMYIRRKVFSSFIDETTGEEKYFSTTEFEDERLYSYLDEYGNRISEKDGHIIETAKERANAEKIGKTPKGYKEGSAGQKPTTYKAPTKAEQAANKKAAKGLGNKNWNKTDAYKAEKKVVGEQLAEKKARLEPYVNKINKLQKRNKRLAIATGAAGVAAAGAGTYAALKGRGKKSED